ncbi:unnamed protein product [Meloidogyne enterolobii]|uniref:Uncharacterized protein n=1 Tax=Meloidogyne enterolobii TaxID=390850 RepID=A0ACB0YXT0_MELEN
MIYKSISFNYFFLLLISLQPFLGYDKFVSISAENPFKKPKNCFNYSLYYYEIKCIVFEGSLNKDGKSMVFGLKNMSTYNWIRCQTKEAEIINMNKESFKITQILDLNNGDIFGCGLVYPPTTKLDEEEEFPYMFFTLNGKQIGKYVFNENILFSYLPTRLTMRTYTLRTYCPGRPTTFEKEYRGI